MRGRPRESFLEGVAQDVAAERIEIDYVDLRGPAFESWDRRALLVHLVRAGLAEAVFFSSKGSAVPPTEVLYKKAVVPARGYFGHTDPVHSQVHLRLLASGIQELQEPLSLQPRLERRFESRVASTDPLSRSGGEVQREHDPKPR